ncbi:MAG: M1 family peptidase, partial [Verrucomicrobiae bacterium]|nr:M1 family peptidase [Verrucomicrobiae bacterium]
MNPASNTYTGFTRVELEFVVPTNRFRFHARSMDLGPASLNGGNLTLTVSTNPAGWVTAQADSLIPTGVHTFECSFTNNFNRDGAGLYKTISGGKNYLVTQFEPMDARQAFPCWDEPGFKIPWRITVTAPEGLVVVGNMPIANTVSRDGTTTHEFGRTPPMPSYLVALAVGPFETVDIPGQSVPGRLVTPSGQARLAEMARGYAPPLLAALERYFGIPHPYPKLDHLAVPAFASGAMENVGAITYREGLLLLDEKHAAIEQRRLLVLIVTHEMAHQWFGNLVTMRWWEDLWLNEAFASWAAFKIGRQLYPDLRFDLMEYESGASARAVDSQPSVKAILPAKRQNQTPISNLGGVPELLSCP